MKIELEVKKTVSGYLVSGFIDGRPLDPDVATTKRQTGNLVKWMTMAALGTESEPKKRAL